MSKWKVPVQSLIDHIKTAVDVDPWAKEMAEELLKEQEAVVCCKDCKNWVSNGADLDELPYWLPCKDEMRRPDYFCADGERDEA